MLWSELGNFVVFDKVEIFVGDVRYMFWKVDGVRVWWWGKFLGV